MRQMLWPESVLLLTLFPLLESGFAPQSFHDIIFKLKTQSPGSLFVASLGAPSFRPCIARLPKLFVLY